ncbi:gp22 [Aeromonas phage 31]|uniref:Prohead core scaffold protein n=4 Tax=Biquartavirus TaxID=1912143 RepID=Q6U9E2_9CAUD|nr:head scaffolding protein [Aeromonas phage 44RR2.8t]YP_238887.1 head scaffolding protein [Aeromonas phage 31]APU00632.1 prohead assembly (scaffolding) protein [Aeromonas phage 44RR2.8t.2]APU01052.1 prohead assembly (scaffolding) protein [Aeromonas phage 31.2]APU01962.1 prohead assembly (scaffolding) protein [Aeromonas phage L9-6]APU02214.1 prohead assembly (scaffolding) protein [Aeromonas phage Riv-10]APU02460.1 prohead assembly (scaffolding) protein [Aeromonas phage SW69-9]UYD59715.1 caps
MSLKDKLLAESSEKLGAVAVELDSIFESVQLDDSVKANVSTAFEQSVRSAAIKLAESHINDMASSAETQLAEAVETARVASETKLYEDADKFLTHLGKTWLAENKQAVQTSIKAELFESMTIGLKELFIENNISVPDEQVNVVAELNTDLDEATAEVKSLFDKNLALEEQVASLQKEKALSEATMDLTMSQKEKVLNLVEGLEFGDKFAGKLSAIVEMVTASNQKTQEELQEQALNIDESAAAVNFEPEAINEQKEKQANDPMAAYLAAASRMS